MNYYASLVTLLVGVKLVLALLLLGPWVWGRLLRAEYVLIACIIRFMHLGFVAKSYL